MRQLIQRTVKLKGLLQRFAEEEDAVGVVEIILILVVLIGLVIISKSRLLIWYRVFSQKLPNRVILFNRNICFTSGYIREKGGGVLPV